MGLRDLFLHMLILKTFESLHFKNIISQLYAKLKEELARKFEFDRDSYTSAKSDFIQNIINKALDNKLLYPHNF